MTVESQDGRAMVRTVQEIRAGRATITVTVDAPVPLGGQEDRVYTQAEIDQYQTNEEMHLEQIGKLRGWVSELEEKVRGYDEDRHTERDRADRLKEQLAQSRELVDFKNRILNDRDRDLEAVRVVADREKRRADEAEAKLMEGHVCTGGCTENSHVAFVGRQALVKLENKVAELTRRIDNARVLLSTPEVTGALNRAVRDQRESGFLAQAIEKALDTLG